MQPSGEVGSNPGSTPESAKKTSLLQRMLDIVEAAGNRVPHPAVIFLLLIAVVVVVSHIMEMANASVSFQVLNQETDQLEAETSVARSLLSSDGIRFIYTQLIPNFMGFSAVGLMIVAMVGAGVAEESGLIQALIRKLVILSPKAILAYILVFVGILSSVGADAGYLVLIPLAGTAFLSIGRHPLAGLAAGFAAVAGAFTVNMLIKPLDAVLTEFTNDAIHLVDPSRSIGLTANLWFSLASVPLLTIIITLVTERIIEPRLGAYTGEKPIEKKWLIDAARVQRAPLLAMGHAWCPDLFGLLTIPAEAPLRDPASGAIIGNSPFMNGLIAVIMVMFLATGIAYGIGAGTIAKTNDVINAIGKSISGLGGTIFLLLIISQFVAYFNYSNMGTILAVNLSNMLKDANVGPFWLLMGLIVVVGLLDFLITGAIAKWAIFAPIFVPVLVKLNVDPEAALAAYRIADSPINMITPLNVYFAMVVGFAQKYDKNAGVGTIVSLMLPYVVFIFAGWILLFIAWYLLGIPWGI